VFVVRDGRARLQPVTIGEGTGTQTRVLGGLAEHDAVISHPSDSVAEGVRIQPRR
jgi:hypothetical protein